MEEPTTTKVNADLLVTGHLWRSSFVFSISCCSRLGTSKLG